MKPAPSLVSETLDAFPSNLDSLTFRFEDIPRVLRRIVDFALEEYSLNRSQWRLLAYVLREEGMTQTELARVLEVERASAGQTIDALEGKGLLMRAKSPDDRRVWRILPSDNARALVPQLRDTISDIHGQMFAGFEPSEVALLHNFLERIMTNLEK